MAIITFDEIHPFLKNENNKSIFAFGNECLPYCQLYDIRCNIRRKDDSIEELTVDKQKLVRLVNEYRSNGCESEDTYYPSVGSIVWNAKLAQAAKVHSEDMEQHDFFLHTGSNGRSAGERITAPGYIWQTWAENIAMGYTSEEEVVIGWINSERQCKNIMNGNLQDMGVAWIGEYWTQKFGKPR